MKQEKNDSFYHFRLPQHLRQAAIKKAREQDDSLASVIRRFLRDWIKNDKEQ